MFTNKTLNFKVHTGRFDDSTGNQHWFAKMLWPIIKNFPTCQGNMKVF